MSNLPITQLPSASIATGSNVLPIVQGGVTDQITVTNLAQGIFNLGLPITASVINQADYIDFNTGSAVPAWKSGRIFWDNVDGCLSVYNAEIDTTLQVGQENWTRIRNNTGTTITNGTVVRVIGAQGDVPTVARAQSIAKSGSINVDTQILGVATHDIEDSSFGYVTTQGLVRGLNTNAFNDGDSLFVGTGSAGVLQNTAPRAPYEIIPVGVCVKASPGGSGIIYVAVQQPLDFSDLSSVLVTGSYSYGDIWTYIPSGSFGVWSHQKQLSGSYAVTGSWSATSFTGSLTGSVNGAVIDNTAWTSYTPVWTSSGTAPVIGNGTITGQYKLIGKTCFVRGNVAMGSSTTFGSGEWYISMPFTASNADAILMTATLLDNGSAWYNATMAGARAGFNYKAPMQYVNITNGTASDVNATQPFTWANTDRFLWNGSFEIA
jgi:hypothetical protein